MEGNECSTTLSGNKQSDGLTLYKLRSIVDFTEKDKSKVVKYWLDSTQHYAFTPQSTMHLDQFYKISDVITDDSGFKLFNLVNS